MNGSIVKRWIYKDQLTPAAELDSLDNVVSLFAPGYIKKNDSTYAIITDHLGSVRLVVNTQSGAIRQRIDYDEFGNIVLNTNPDFQPFGYAGGLFDDQTKLTRFGARDYDALTGRWAAKDPIRFEGAQSNLYEYVLNDPINRLDLNGKLGFQQHFLIGFGIGFTQSMVLEHKSIGESVLVGAASGLATGTIGFLGDAIKVSTQSKALLGGIGFFAGFIASGIASADNDIQRPFISGINNSVWTMILMGETHGRIGAAVAAAFVAITDLIFQEVFNPERKRVNYSK